MTLRAIFFPLRRQWQNAGTSCGKCPSYGDDMMETEVGIEDKQKMGIKKPILQRSIFTVNESSFYEVPCKKNGNAKSDGC